MRIKAIQNGSMTVKYANRFGGSKLIFGAPKTNRLLKIVFKCLEKKDKAENSESRNLWDNRYKRFRARLIKEL